MRRNILWGIILCHVFAQMLPTLSVGKEGATLLVSYSKKHKPKKHYAKRHKPKHKHDSLQHIEKVLKNDKVDGVCNRLECASNLQIAKSCLNTKASRRKHRDCLEAFCAYGCNEEDYRKKTDLYDFCNLTCASKRNLRR